MDDVIINKIASIERCLARIEQEYRGFEQEFASNHTKQDSVILNLQRAVNKRLIWRIISFASSNLAYPKAPATALNCSPTPPFCPPNSRTTCKAWSVFATSPFTPIKLWI